LRAGGRDGTTALVIKEGQWADEGMLEFLRFLAALRVPKTSSVLVMSTLITG
jgi:hypothetical protein